MHIEVTTEELDLITTALADYARPDGDVDIWALIDRLGAEQPSDRLGGRPSGPALHRSARQRLTPSPAAIVLRGFLGAGQRRPAL